MDGLSSKAKQFFSIVEKEGNMVTKKTEAVQGVTDDEMPVGNEEASVDVFAENTPVETFDFAVDSPKSLWDAVGHIQFKFAVYSLEEAEAKLDEIVGFWAIVKEKYADLFNQAATMTPAQKTYLEKLFGIPLPEGMDKLNKEEASHKIEEELKAQNKAKIAEGVRQQTAASASKYSYAKKNEAPPTSNAEGGNQASEKTLHFMESIAKRKKLQLPNDYVFMSQSDASNWIKVNNQ